MNPGLYNLLKFAAAKPQEKLDQHFGQAGGKRWSQFRKNLRSKGFLEAVQKDERADDKLKTFSQMVHLHKTGKGPTFSIKGSSGRQYSVKYHPNLDIYSCSCPDWTIVKSQTAGECKHIKEAKSQVSMVKKASAALRELAGLGRLGLQSYRNEKNDEQAWNVGEVNKIHHNLAVQKRLRRMG